MRSQGYIFNYFTLPLSNKNLILGVDKLLEILSNSLCDPEPLKYYKWTHIIFAQNNHSIRSLTLLW